MLRLLNGRGAEASGWQDLAVLTVYTVQFRYDADPTPLGLDRPAINERVNELLDHLQRHLRQESEPLQA